MKLWSDSFTDGGVIPPECAFAVIEPASHVRLSTNRNPHLAWDDVPAGTESLILFCHDVDAPSVGTNVNREGKVVPFERQAADGASHAQTNVAATQTAVLFKSYPGLSKLGTQMDQKNLVLDARRKEGRPMPPAKPEKEVKLDAVQPGEIERRALVLQPSPHF